MARTFNDSILYVTGDLTQASAPISIVSEDGLESTPYQTADARHDRDRAVLLVAEYLAANGCSYAGCRGVWMDDENQDEDGDYPVDIPEDQEE